MHWQLGNIIPDILDQALCTDSQFPTLNDYVLVFTTRVRCRARDYFGRK